MLSECFAGQYTQVLGWRLRQCGDYTKNRALWARLTDQLLVLIIKDGLMTITLPINPLQKFEPLE